MDVKNLKLEPESRYKHLEKNPVAFFCAEYAFDEDSSMYAGGLGVLAGDFILESADEGLPFIALGLWYGGPRSPIRAKEFSILEKDGEPIIVESPFQEETIKARVWVRRFAKSVYLLLLDTNISENSEENKPVAGHLYDSDFHNRMKQEILLGVGGVKLLDKLGIKPSVYHLNEGHSALAGLELIVEATTKSAFTDIELALKEVREKVVATKHTIFAVAGGGFSEEEFIKLLGPYCQRNNVSINEMFKLGEHKEIPKVFSSTQFLLSCADRQNGVSLLHTVSEKKLHPHSKLMPVTNGIYDKRWQAESWHEDGKEKLSDEEFWAIKKNLRERLLGFVKEKTGVALDPKICTVVWARRFAKYKRPELLFSDLERLKQICANKSKVQFIISGKAHEADKESQIIVDKIKHITKTTDFLGKIVYVPDYSITLATEFVLGADVWLNTPERGFEACGTSGMKAGLNGTLQASVSDGWIDEVDWSEIGFILPEKDTARALYDILEKEILPLFYKTDSQGLPVEWIKRMRETQKIIESGFTTKRMLQDYLRKVYKVL